MTEFLSALIGALLGAFMVFIAELWRQVLNGKAAARFIYAELHYNADICDGAIRTGQFYAPLSDTAWQTHGIEVAPLLTEEASQHSLIAYLAVAITSQGATAESLKAHSGDFSIVAHWMHCIEKKGRFKLLGELLRGKPILPSADQIKHGLAIMQSQD